MILSGAIAGSPLHLASSSRQSQEYIWNTSGTQTMHTQAVATPAANPRVERFFKLIDRLAELRGRNVSTIVNLVALRSLPAGTFGRAWADFLDQH
ncbi:MAG TPA: hypothetical protein V6D04_08435, partial [Candidatus Obscuribacterales bacterium]